MNIQEGRQEAEAVGNKGCVEHLRCRGYSCPTESNSNPETSVHIIDPLPNELSTHQNPIFFFLWLGLKYPEFFVLITLGYCPHLLTGEIIWLFSSLDSPKECR